MKECNICYSNSWFAKQKLEELAKKRWREKHPFKIRENLTEKEYKQYRKLIYGKEIK